MGKAAKRSPGYRTRLLAAVGVAAAGPAIALMGPPALAGGALVVGLCALLAAGAMAWPLGRLSEAVTELGRRAGLAPPTGAQGLAHTVEAVSDRIGDLLKASAQHPATGLARRERFCASVAEAIAQSPGAPGIVGVVRFGDYESIAAFDPAAANGALAAFSERLKASIAANRLIGQVGPDAFGLWFPGAEEPSELQALSYVLSQDLMEGGLNLTPVVVLGAALHPRDGDDPELLLRRAEAALAEPGKAAARTPAFFSAEAGASAKRRFEIAQDARRAVARQQFSLYYQPIVDLSEGRISGAEALLRWNHPTLGAVSPAEFVPILEQSGLMEDLGLWVLNSACRDARAWRDGGLHDLMVAVNLSTVQCRNPQMAQVILRTLERHGLPPEVLELELTETAAMEDGEATRKLLATLKNMGVGVSIDDFGAGYSNLTYLKNLPFSKLKIDREFVAMVDERPDSQAICAALVALAKGLNIKILAEGVERREELETLRGLGCPLFQGFYLARPLPQADFMRAVTDPAWLDLLASPVHRQRAMLQSRAL